LLVALYASIFIFSDTFGLESGLFMLSTGIRASSFLT
jgi:hypothetical protein